MSITPKRILADEKDEWRDEAQSVARKNDIEHRKWDELSFKFRWVNSQKAFMTEQSCFFRAGRLLFSRCTLGRLFSMHVHCLHFPLIMTQAELSLAVLARTDVTERACTVKSIKWSNPNLIVKHVTDVKCIIQFVAGKYKRGMKYMYNGFLARTYK